MTKRVQYAKFDVSDVKFGIKNVKFDVSNVKFDITDVKFHVRDVKLDVFRKNHKSCMLDYSQLFIFVKQLKDNSHTYLPKIGVICLILSYI